MRIRRATPADLPDICQLFRETVLEINSRDYHSEQVEAWAQAANQADVWRSRIGEQHFLLAVRNDILLGFASMASGGYLDLMYVHKDWQGMGIATALAQALEQWARLRGLQLIATDASITARPFFEKQGYTVVAEQTKTLRGQAFVNYSMKKWLD